MFNKYSAISSNKMATVNLTFEDLKNQQKFTIKMHDGEVLANLNEILKNNNSPTKKIDNQPNFFDLIDK